MLPVVTTDAETGDVLKQESTLLIQGMGGMPVVNHYSDYRELNGLRFPYRSVSQNEQNGKTVIQTQSMTSDVKFRRNHFTLKKPKKKRR